MIYWDNIIIYYNIYRLHRLCPIFQVSNVSGENLNLLKMFLNLLTARITSHDDEPAEFQIDDTYSVPVRVILRIIGIIFALLINAIKIVN